MKKHIGALAVFVVLFLHTLAFAHGTGKHIMGTLTDLNAQHMVVKTKDGKTMSILVNEKTTYRKNKAAATSADLKVGDRVVVHTTGKEEPLTAGEIRFSSSGEKKGHEGMTHNPSTP